MLQHAQESLELILNKSTLEAKRPIFCMIVIKNYLSTSQAPLPQLMLIEKLADITKRKVLDHTDGNLLSNLKTAPSTDLLKVRMAACGQIQTLSSQDTAFSEGLGILLWFLPQEIQLSSQAREPSRGLFHKCFGSSCSALVNIYCCVQ